ncbi:MAG: alpha/beta fold hydrolase [Gammaproteobacteria bacterium]
MAGEVKLNAVHYESDNGHELEPVIILHGLFGSARNWQTFAQKLAADFNVFALDMRNHGHSPHIRSMSYPEMSADIVHFMDHNSISRARFIGHSMGGKAAMNLALNSPQRVAQLVIVDIAPVKYKHDYVELLGNLRGLDLSQISRRAEANRLLGEALDDDELRLFLLQNLIVKPGQETRWRINLDSIRDNVNHLVQYVPDSGSTFSGPVDLIRGAQSDYVKESDYPVFERLFPSINFHVIANAGHWPHAQNPSAFLSAVRTILGVE